MTDKKITCKTDLKKKIIVNQIYTRELNLCERLSSENDGECGWEICKNCDVAPLLHKLHKGVLLEDPKDIKKMKDNIIS